MIGVDKGVPLPPASVVGRARRRYPWRELNVGDSFLVPIRKGQTVKALQRQIGSLADSIRNRSGMRFTVRQADDGVRVWRVE